ncbi:MAG: hypothetical protein BWZ10_02718 [candidate division BRC1 bacterium ADurb.BinA364]|nr:MAG: hypothetical protein BWZ10_02718 [candidate division BRC1 bacterium ADurb.BinA364]
MAQRLAFSPRLGYFFWQYASAASYLANGPGIGQGPAERRQRPGRRRRILDRAASRRTLGADDLAAGRNLADGAGGQCGQSMHRTAPRRADAAHAKPPAAVGTDRPCRGLGGLPGDAGSGPGLAGLEKRMAARGVGRGRRGHLSGALHSAESANAVLHIDRLAGGGRSAFDGLGRRARRIGFRGLGLGRGDGALAGAAFSRAGLGPAGRLRSRGLPALAAGGPDGAPRRPAGAGL